MPTPLKTYLSPAAVKAFAANFSRHNAAFPAKAFIRQAKKGLPSLELRARVDHLAHTLQQHLPTDYLAALDTVLHVAQQWQPLASDPYAFMAWPLLEWVGFYGLEHPEASLAGLRQLTPLYSAEFAIRPYLEQHRQLTLTTMQHWCSDPNEHVRRLASEGCRPRLPWGRRLKAFQQNPKPLLKLLNRLNDDPSLYVRRSVANNLNDIAKDHPELMLTQCRRWAKGASEERSWILRHACRSLVKQGHPEALALLGFDPEAKVKLLQLKATPTRVNLGEDVHLMLNLQSTAPHEQPLVIDYAVHHVKQDGSTSAKVFKWKTVTLAGKQPLVLSKKHRLRPIRTRRYYSGKHQVELLVNGKTLGQTHVHLQA